MPRVDRKAASAQDMYNLPPLPDASDDSFKDFEDDIWDEHQQQMSRFSDQDIDNFDINSEDFKALPPEIQHEIIEEYLEKNKHNSWAKKSTLPKEANEFSDFQLNKLLNKNKLNRKLEDIRDEMSRKSSGEIASILDVETKSVEARRVVSEDTQHYILVKTQKQKNAEQNLGDEAKPSGSKDILQVENLAESSKSLWNNKTIGVLEEKESKRPITANDLEIAMQAVFDNQKAKMAQKQARNDQPLEEVTSNDARLNKHDIIVNENSSTSSAYKDLVLSETQDKKRDHVKDGKYIQVITQQHLQLDIQTKSVANRSLLSDATISVADESQLLETSIANTQNVEIVCLKNNSTKQEKDIDEVSDYKDSTSINQTDCDKILNDDRLVKNQEIQKTPTEEELESGRKNVLTNEMDKESDSEDDFIEVSFDPTQIRGNDELFPAEIFMETNPGVPVTDDMHNYEVQDKDEIQHKINTKNRKQSITLQRKEEQFMESISKDKEKSIKEWTDMNTKNVSEMKNALEEERATLKSEQQRQQRIGASITDQMYAESKELLELFGIPYITSPQEAEAQCAFLDLCDQTHGSITDDSDVWLFGGRKVYKNFFTKDKEVELYESCNFENQLFLDRIKMINMGLLLGCDYTDGLDGVGCITAMEILSEFPGKGIDGLRDFRAWWDANSGNLNPPVETKIKSQLRKLDLPSTFPQEEVLKAFMNPLVDESTEEFSWGMPDLDSIRGFALERLNWNIKKTDENVLPVLKKMNEQNVQRQITSYFGIVAHQNSDIQSKRLKRVLKKFQPTTSYSDSEEKSDNQQGKKKKKALKQKRKCIKVDSADDTKKTTTESGNKQDIKCKPIKRRKKGKKNVLYKEESGSDEANTDDKSKQTKGQVEGPNLSESGSSSD
ncbi:DNA excision repair protein ERCC-5 homolog isoform X2 [Antedon mediterranea]